MSSSLKRFLIKKLGGFVDIDDCLESIRGSKEKRYILSLAVKRLYNTIGSDDILKVHDTGQWMFAGKPLSSGETKLLVAEATSFLETKLWKLLQTDIKYQANRKMFLLAENEEQLTAGKLWLLTIEAISQRLENMKLGNGSFNKK